MLISTIGWPRFNIEGSTNNNETPIPTPLHPPAYSPSPSNLLAKFWAHSMSKGPQYQNRPEQGQNPQAPEEQGEDYKWERSRMNLGSYPASKGNLTWKTVLAFVTWVGYKTSQSNSEPNDGILNVNDLRCIMALWPWHSNAANVGGGKCQYLRHPFYGPIQLETQSTRQTRVVTELIRCKIIF